MKRLFLDCETTGIDKEIHAIHQLSGYIEIDGNIVETFDFKICPDDGMVINPKALEVSGVTYEQIMKYPPETEGYFEFKNMITRYVESFDRKDKFVFVGYNAKFDLEMVNQMFLRNGNKFFFSLVYSGIVDVMTMFVDKFESALYLLDNFKLITVAQFLEIKVTEENLHNSLYDIFLTREIFYKLKSIDYSYNHIELNELRRFWDSVYPRLTEDNAGKCIITSTPKQTGIIPSLLNNDLFYQLNVFWETPIISITTNPTAEDNFYMKLYQKQQDEIYNIPMATEKEKRENHLLNEADRKNEISKVFLQNSCNSSSDSSAGPKPMIKVNLGYVMKFGKHKGESIEQIMDYDSNYILWLDMEHPFGIFVPIEILNTANRLAFEQRDNWFKKRKEQTHSEYLTKHGKLDDYPTDDLPF